MYVIMVFPLFAPFSFMFISPRQGLGCDMLQVGSTNDPSTSGDYDVIVKDLRELADEAAKQNPPIRM